MHGHCENQSTIFHLYESIKNRGRTEGKRFVKEFGIDSDEGHVSTNGWRDSIHQDGDTCRQARETRVKRGISHAAPPNTRGLEFAPLDL